MSLRPIMKNPRLGIIIALVFITALPSHSVFAARTDSDGLWKCAGIGVLIGIAFTIGRGTAPPEIRRVEVPTADTRYIEIQPDPDAISLTWMLGGVLSKATEFDLVKMEALLPEKLRQDSPESHPLAIMEAYGRLLSGDYDPFELIPHQRTDSSYFRGQSAKRGNQFTKAHILYSLGKHYKFTNVKFILYQPKQRAAEAVQINVPGWPGDFFKQYPYGLDACVSFETGDGKSFTANPTLNILGPSEDYLRDYVEKILPQ